MGITYVEGYGMSETIAATHINPPDRPKKQCLGIPIFDVDAVWSTPTPSRNCRPGEVGEIIVHGPQVLQGLLEQAPRPRAAFVEIDGKRFPHRRPGRVDEDGYFFMVDRLKRMINASGFKVWPAEVEALMYQHPAIQEACVIGAKDPHRGETVKAVVVLKEAQRARSASRTSSTGRTPHGRLQGAAHRRVRRDPAQVGTGKVMWRALQEKEAARSPNTRASPRTICRPLGIPDAGHAGLPQVFNHRVGPRQHGRLQVAAPGRVRRDPAQVRHRQGDVARAAGEGSHRSLTP
jgi:fatty-acyl-CoA synthase